MPENALPLYELYLNSPLEVVSLKPSDNELDEIGHLGFFSRRKYVLWPIVTRWLEQTLSADQSQSDFH